MGFFVRVVLHYASPEAYSALHRGLSNIDIVDCIKGDDGVWYRMAPGEYVFDGAMRLEQLRDLTASIADTVWPSNSVFVCERGASAWRGLTPLTPSANTALFGR